VEHGFGLGDLDVGADAEVFAPVSGNDAPGPADVDLDLAIDVSVLDAIEQELADVQRALALLDEGTYGHCEACGRALDEGILTRAPATRFCPDHLPLGPH